MNFRRRKLLGVSSLLEVACPFCSMVQGELVPGLVPGQTQGTSVVSGTCRMLIGCVHPCPGWCKMKSEEQSLLDVQDRSQCDSHVHSVGSWMRS